MIEPPTFNKITDLTWVSQMIVDTYGIPSYQEANPTPVSIVTFPFMFGMMFGDMGHGSILAFFGLFLVMAAPQLQKTALKDLLKVRYFLLLMGCSSLYCGFMYNEFFAMPTQIFSSCYEVEDKKMWPPATDPTGKGNYYYPRKDFGCNYPLGVDPVWGLATTKLTFSNGIKMKLSVIMGIVHMTIGVIIKGTNAIFRKDYPTLIFEVITGLVMLLGLFGWMDLLIYGKWFFPLDFSSRNITQVTGVSEYEGDLVNRLTPSVINIMITSVFSGGSVPTQAQGTGKPYLAQYAFLVSGVADMKGKPFNEVYPPSVDQQNSMYNISMVLLVFAIICVPLMLLVKPLCCRPKGDHHANEEIEFANIQVAEAD